MNILGPLPAFNFYVSLVEDPNTPVVSPPVLKDLVLGGFSECAGLDSEIQIEERRVGGENDRVHKFPTRANFSNITLTRGIGFSEDLYLWHQSFLNGQGKRRNGLIFLANEARVPIKVWKFERGIPVKWSGPSLNATSSALAIEKLEIAHEKLSLVMSPGKAVDQITAPLSGLFGG